MAEAEVLYSDIKFKRARGNTDVATPSTDEATYSEVKISKTQRPGSKQPAASNRRSGVTSERVALLVLSVLLAAAVTALGVTHEACPRCEDGWEPHGGKCYFFSSVTLTWDQSRTECRSMRGDLVVINNREEQRFLVSRLRGKMDTHDDRFWIGLTDSKNESEWLWVDDTRLNTSLTFWRDYEPNNLKYDNSDGEDCVRMGQKKGAEELKAWKDESCKSPQKSICEKPEKA
ncbi:hepatic lectin-like isoform X5 [Hippoglossus stenolepis]|uniref:hepatic lectin-like isoform X5 n=1 Tax=Hippoglossus stenolepis TaxID=195615 RepID=UPI001FAFCE40|nr:hepatic lectin-like isoform X5 [Hippoglossus stenolepis]